MNKPLKLYVVRVEFEYLALAASDWEAEAFAREAAGDNDELPEAREWDGKYPEGWTENCNVYHDDMRDIRVIDAIAIHEMHNTVGK